MSNSSWTKLNKGNYDWLYHSKEIFDFDLFEKFIAENDFVSVRKGRGTCTLKWFLENGRDVPFKAYPRQRMAVEKILGGKLPEPYLADHDYYFKLPSGECVYISQPYTSKEEAEPYVQKFAKQQGVKVVVYDGSYSWYYPNCEDICVIVISLPNRDVKMYNTSKSTPEKEKGV